MTDIREGHVAIDDLAIRFEGRQDLVAALDTTSLELAPAPLPR